MLATAPGLAGQYLRRAFLIRVLSRCARTATIEYGTVFSHAGARLEDGAYIGPYCTVGLIHIEAGALIGPGVQLLSGGHTHGSDDPSRPIRDQPIDRRLVRIGRGAWIGAGAIVMADVGANAIVGAGAVVTEQVPAGVVAAGVPARVLRQRA
jgi:acetyltransferase-like isoleucine patch superfamily enzyme